MVRTLGQKEIERAIKLTAMTTPSDNETIYIDSSDDKLKFKDSLGSVSDLTTGIGGSSLTITTNCSISEQVGDFVYVSGSGAVSKASNTSQSTAPTIGFIINKPTTTTCKVQQIIKLSGLTGLVPGETYFLGVSGAIVTPAPTVSGTIIQTVGIALSTTELIVNPETNYYIA